MEMKDSRVIAASQDLVWQAILSPEVLRACVPGCSDLTGTADTGFDATVVQKVGPVKATFKGQVTVSDLDPPTQLRLMGEGKGGAAGFAKGSALVTLAAHPEGTELTYEVEARVGGKLAQLGSRIVDGFAKKMADQFFANLQEALEGPQDSEDTEPQAEEPSRPKRGWFKSLVSG